MERTQKRLRRWLEQVLEEQSCPGVDWINKDEGIFKIPWYHMNKCEGKDVPIRFKIFRDWALYTKKCNEGDKPDYTQYKTNLRCALTKIPDVVEIEGETDNKNLQHPYKVYRFTNWPLKVDSSQSPDSTFTGDIIQTFIGDINQTFTGDINETFTLGDVNQTQGLNIPLLSQLDYQEPPSQPANQFVVDNEEVGERDVEAAGGVEFLDPDYAENQMRVWQGLDFFPPSSTQTQDANNTSAQFGQSVPQPNDTVTQAQNVLPDTTHVYLVGMLDGNIQQFRYHQHYMIPEIGQLTVIPETGQQTVIPETGQQTVTHCGEILDVSSQPDLINQAMTSADILHLPYENCASESDILHLPYENCASETSADILHLPYENCASEFGASKAPKVSDKTRLENPTEISDEEDNIVMEDWKEILQENQLKNVDFPSDVNPGIFGSVLAKPDQLLPMSLESCKEEERHEPATGGGVVSEDGASVSFIPPSIAVEGRHALKITLYYGSNPSTKIMETTVGEKGCRLFYGQKVFEHSIIDEQMYGPKLLEQLEMPAVDQVESVQTEHVRPITLTLDSMTRGLTLTFKDGDIYVKRLCLCKIFVCDDHYGCIELDRKSNTGFKVFDFKSFEKQFNSHSKIPCYFLLTFGRKPKVGEASDPLRKVMIHAYITHCRALELSQHASAGASAGQSSLEPVLSDFNSLDKIENGFRKLSLTGS